MKVKSSEESRRMKDVLKQELGLRTNVFFFTELRNDWPLQKKGRKVRQNGRGRVAAVVSIGIFNHVFTL